MRMMGCIRYVEAGTARSPEWSDEVFPLFTPEDFGKLFGYKLIDKCGITLTSYHGNEYPGIVALLKDI